MLGTAGGLTCSNCIVTGDADPLFVSEYPTGSRIPTINQPEQQTIFVPAAFDEGGNYIRLRFGPLTRWDTTDRRALRRLPHPGWISGGRYGRHHPAQL